MTPRNRKSSTPEDIDDLGADAGLSAQSSADAGPEEAPAAGDLATANTLGRRIADATRQIRG
jgi:NAD(P)H dehydrogenase (quinone)